MCAWAKMSRFVLRWVLEVFIYVSGSSFSESGRRGGSGSASGLSAGREACSCSGGLVGGPQGRGALFWGAPADPAPAVRPLLVCLCHSVLPKIRPLLTPATES